MGTLVCSRNIWMKTHLNDSNLKKSNELKNKTKSDNGTVAVTHQFELMVIKF